MEKKRRNSVIAIALLLMILMVCGSLISCAKEEPAQENKTVTTKEKEEINSRVEEKEESLDQEEPEEVAEEDVAEDVKEYSMDSKEAKKETVTKKVSNTSNTSKKTTSTSASTSSNSSHTHHWVKSVTTVHHDAEGHYEKVCVQEAYTKEYPLYETVAYEICNECGSDITKDIYNHTKNHALKGENAGYHTGVKQVQTGTQTVSYPAKYEQQWIVDKEAWDEEIVTYTCNCGATK